MKAFRIRALAFVLAGTLLVTGTGLAGTARAAEDKETVQTPLAKTLTPRPISVNQGVNIYVNNVPYQPQDVDGNSVEPFGYNGTTYLPARAIANIYGASIRWDGKTNSVYIGKASGPQLNLTPKLEDTPLRKATINVTTDINIFVEGKDGAYERFVPRDVDGSEVPIIVCSGTTYLPARAIANIYGVDIAWDQEYARVYIGERFHVDDPKQYNKYQLEALRIYNEMERQLSTMYIIGERIFERYSYAVEVKFYLDELIGLAPTEEKQAEYQKIYSDFEYFYNFMADFLFRKYKYFKLDRDIERHREEAYSIDDAQKLSDFQLAEWSYNRFVLDYGRIYKALDDEAMLEKILYIENELEQLNYDFDWFYCYDFPGLDEARNRQG